MCLSKFELTQNMLMGGPVSSLAPSGAPPPKEDESSLFEQNKARNCSRYILVLVATIFRDALTTQEYFWVEVSNFNR